MGLSLLDSSTTPVVLAVVSCIAGYFLFFKKSDEDKFNENRSKTIIQTNLKAPKKVNTRNFVERMKNGDRTMVIFYGSQTGTGEEFAFRISQNARRYGIKSLVVNPEDVDYEELENMKENLDLSKNITVVMCLATYGEGDPTDNAQEMYDWLIKEAGDRPEDMLEGINYAIFGLGNRTYEQFCAVGIKMDKQLEKFGAERLIDVGLGDDNDNIEEDFVKWEENLWSTITVKYDIDVSKISADTQNIYQLKTDINPESNFFTGEPYRLNSYKTQKKPFLANKNPFLSKIIDNRSTIVEEKRANASRNYMHVDFDLTDSGLRYEAGDHMAVLCPNSDELVDQILKLLKIEDSADQLINLKAVDEEAPKQHPFPCPTTWRVAFKHYLDLSIPPRANVINSLVKFCTDEIEKTKMINLAKVGSETYESYMINARRGIVHLLQDFPSCQPSAELVAQILPRIQPRYYSISSSYRLDSSKVSICCVEVDWISKNSNHRQIKGLATGFLASQEIGSTVPMWIRRSQFKLPFRSKFPVIMIGPGTGLAPFKGFLDERKWLKSKGKEVGKNILFTGFRTSAADYIYEKELLEYQADGTLDELHVAFSRDGPKKVYVQHLLQQNRNSIWKLIEEGAYIYICGDAKNMARDVQNVLLDIIRENLGKGSNSADTYLKSLTNRGRYLLDVWS